MNNNKISKNTCNISKLLLNDSESKIDFFPVNKTIILSSIETLSFDDSSIINFQTNQDKINYYFDLWQDIHGDLIVVKVFSADINNTMDEQCCKTDNKTDNKECCKINSNQNTELFGDNDNVLLKKQVLSSSSKTIRGNKLLFFVKKQDILSVVNNK